MDKSTKLQGVNILNKGKDERETVEMVKELQSHVQQVNHNNSQLKTKLQFFKNLYETESKKRMPYDHIPPRVESGMPKKLVTSSGRSNSLVICC